MAMLKRVAGKVKPVNRQQAEELIKRSRKLRADLQRKEDEIEDEEQKPADQRKNKAV